MKSDKWIGLIAIVFSGLMCWQTRDFPSPICGSLGAGFFPNILFILLAATGVALIIGGCLEERKQRRSGEAVDRGGLTWGQFLKEFKKIVERNALVIISFFLFFCYVIMLDYFGYTVATLVFMPILIWVLGPRNRRAIPMIIIISLGMTFVIYFVFLEVFHVFLPSGKLF
jgi:putative tricarboxylic transport membrane protein